MTTAGVRPMPLDGIRVVDQTQVMAGPFCTMLLADMGADVIKVEPPDGEHTRAEMPLPSGVSGAFLAVNRNKRGITVDLKQPEGVEILKRLARTADVLVENYRPGVAHRLGVDWETLSALNGRLVYCSISGFGQTGPYAGRGGFDLVAQGMSGIMSVTGAAGGPPAKVGVPVTDLGAGLLAAFGILCALRARRRTGRGQRVDTSLFEAGLALSATAAAAYGATGRAPGPLGTADDGPAPHQAFAAADGWFVVDAGSDAAWRRFAAVLGLEAFAEAPRWDGAGRRRDRAELAAAIETVTRRAPRAQWLARCAAAGVLAAPVLTVPEALDDPHARARGMVQALPHPQAGATSALGNPVKLSGSPARARAAAPVLGAANDAVLGELGYGADAVAALRARRVI